jgi:hypothetical protein
MSAFARRLAAVCLVAVAGCARQPAASDDYAVSGELNLARSQITVYINGEPVAQGPLWMREPLRPFGPGRSAPDPFPLRGSYNGQPVEVECAKQPVVGDPVCDVTLGGAHIGTLMFDPEGLAGTAAERAAR